MQGETDSGSAGDVEIIATQPTSLRQRLDSGMKRAGATSTAGAGRSRNFGKDEIEYEEAEVDGSSDESPSSSTSPAPSSRSSEEFLKYFELRLSAGSATRSTRSVGTTSSPSDDTVAKSGSPQSVAVGPESEAVRTTTGEGDWTSGRVALQEASTQTSPYLSTAPDDTLPFQSTLTASDDFYASTFVMYAAIANVTAKWDALDSIQGDSTLSGHEEDGALEEPNGSSSTISTTTGSTFLTQSELRPQLVATGGSYDPAVFQVSRHTAASLAGISLQSADLLSSWSTSRIADRVIYERRTGASFDRAVSSSAPLAVADFEFLLARLVPDFPAEGRFAKPQKVLLLLHNVEMYTSGMYLLQPSVSASSRPQLELVAPMHQNQTRILGQNAACGQTLGGNGFLALAVLSQFKSHEIEDEAAVAHHDGGDHQKETRPAAAWSSQTDYRTEHLQAGRLVHRLYVATEYLRIRKDEHETGGATASESKTEAEEAAISSPWELRASGMGCFVDAYFSEVLLAGWAAADMKPLYMAAVGPSPVVPRVVS
ncbi:unnamed protein product [Amoebophrya sp. A120]|nr:unnamed protein product [Amoebophrya sp. A120]|eukprot:GSA120T00020328001.1